MLSQKIEAQAVVIIAVSQVKLQLLILELSIFKYTFKSSQQVLLSSQKSISKLSKTHLFG